MRLLVTGGAGFIGSNFIRYWLRRYESDRVINFDLLTYAGDVTSLADVEAQFPDRYTLVRGDIADHLAVGDALEIHRPQLIVNFAAESHNSRALLDPIRFVRTNVLGTQVLLSAAQAARVERFHHISTCEVFGDLPLGSPDKFDEESPYRPQTPYNASKAAADLMVRAFHHTHGLPVTVSNSANNYGRWQHPEKVIPLFTTNALDNRPLPLYRRSDHRREWLHVDDHCRALDLIIKNGRVGETYNVGSGDERSIEDVADAILEILGAPKSLKSYVPDRPGHDRRYLLDHSRITRELGWEPRVGFDEGLRDTVAWYARERAWWEPKRREVALDEAAWQEPTRA